MPSEEQPYALSEEQPDALIEKDIYDLKQHVVQIEAVLTYLLICMVAFFLALQSNHGVLVWATAIVSLLGIGQVMRVRNPASQIRARALNAASGAAGGIGTGIAIDTAFGGMTLGAAAALGGLIGGVLGALAPVPGAEEKKWLDWAETFKMLYEHREKCPTVANDANIRGVMDHEIKYFEFTPGVRSYNIEDIKKFLHNCSK